MLIQVLDPVFCRMAAAISGALPVAELAQASH